MLVQLMPTEHIKFKFNHFVAFMQVLIQAII